MSKIETTTGKLKILLITLRADPGGGPEHVYQLMKHSGSDFQFFIAAPKDKPYWERFESLIGSAAMIELPHRKFTLRHLWALKRAANIRHYDLIHSHGKGAGIYSRPLAVLTGIPCLHTFHGVHLGEYNRLMKSIYLMIERILTHFTSRLIAVSESEALEVLNHRIALRDKIKVVENGVEIPLLSQKKSKNSNHYHIVTVTRFDYAKNPELLGTIVNMLLSGNMGGQFVFDVVGDGEERQIFETAVSGYIDSGQVVMHGFLDDPFQIIDNSWLYLSTSRWESFGLATAEALVRSIPVIATDITGSKDIIVNGENGFLFPLNEPDEAVRLISELASDHSLYHTLSINARRTSEERFSAQRMADETGSLYRKLLEPLVTRAI